MTHDPNVERILKTEPQILGPAGAARDRGRTLARPPQQLGNDQRLAHPTTDFAGVGKN